MSAHDKFFIFFEEKMISLMDKLRPFQQERVDQVVNQLLTYGQASYPFIVGAGNVITTIAIATRLNMKICVICRKITMSAWKQGFEFWDIPDYEYSSYESFFRKQYYTSNNSQKQSCPYFDNVIADNVLIVFDDPPWNREKEISDMEDKGASVVCLKCPNIVWKITRCENV